MSEVEIMVFVTITWGLAVIAYYFAGKKHGYAQGYVDGIEKGHQNVISAFQAKAEYIQDLTP